MKFRKYINVSLIILALILIFIGWLSGFPWERIKAANEVKRYVEQKYSLTVTHVNTSFFIDKTGSARVYTEEHPFSFQVIIKRENMEVHGDLYLETLVEYHLEESIEDTVATLGDDIEVIVSLRNRFSKDSPEVTIKEINAAPDIIFSIPQITYSCIIDGIEVGTERSFVVFNKITSQFTPEDISFIHYDKHGKKTYVSINKNDFKKVKNANDLTQLGG